MRAEIAETRLAQTEAEAQQAVGRRDVATGALALAAFGGVGFLALSQEPGAAPSAAGVARRFAATPRINTPPQAVAPPVSAPPALEARQAAAEAAAEARRAREAAARERRAVMAQAREARAQQLAQARREQAERRAPRAETTAAQAAAAVAKRGVAMRPIS